MTANDRAGPLNVLVFGATGMIGQGVVRECLMDPGVRRVQTIGRTATGVQDPKLRDLVHTDLWHYDSIERDLSGFDACFFCLGVASAGTTEVDYERVTYGITVAAAETPCDAGLHPDDGTDRPSDVDGGSTRGAHARSGKSRHQRRRVGLRAYFRPPVVNASRSWSARATGASSCNCFAPSAET